MKINHVYKHILLGLIIAGAYTPATQSMHHAKKAFHKGCTALHWGIFAGPPVIFGLKCLSFSHQHKQLKDAEISPTLLPFHESNFASPQLTSFAQDELHNAKFENAHKIHIFTALIDDGASSPMGQAGSIILDKSAEDTILTGSEQDKNKLRATLHHEATHLVQNHHKKHMLTLIALPFALQAALHPIKSSLRKKNITISKPLLHSLAKIPTAFSKLACVALMTNAHQRSHEWKADAGVRDEPAVLHAWAQEFKQVHEIAQEMVALEARGALKASWLRNINPVVNLLSDHPLHKKRAEHFEERARRIEAQQAVAQKKD